MFSMLERAVFLLFGFGSWLFIREHALINAFATGPGSCDAGIPLQGSHLLDEQIGDGGQLAGKGFAVSLDGNRLEADNATDVLIRQRYYNVTLEATTEDSFFRGFLIRIDGDVDTTDYLDIDDRDDAVIQVLPLCTYVEKVGGVAHKDANEKAQVSAKLFLREQVLDLLMDVTVVVENRGGFSEYYNSRFILNAVSFPTVSPAPTQLPTTTPRPSAIPIEVPSIAPTVLSGVPTNAPSTSNEVPTVESTSNARPCVFLSILIVSTVLASSVLLI